MSGIEVCVFMALASACVYVLFQLLPDPPPLPESKPKPVDPGVRSSKVVFWLCGEDGAEPSGPYEVTWLLGRYKAGALDGTQRVLVCDTEGQIVRETWVDALALAEAQKTTSIPTMPTMPTIERAPVTAGAGLAKAGLILTAMGGGLMIVDTLAGGFAGLLSVALLGIGIVLWVVGSCLK